jgi:hypothetical protein
VTAQPGQAPGVVKIRLLGAAEDIDQVADLLSAHGQVIDRSAPYPNRRDPGVRVYLTVVVQEGGK